LAGNREKRYITEKQDRTFNLPLALLKLCQQDYWLPQGRQGPITNLAVGKLALYYYKRAEIARIFASSESYSAWDNQ
jgi:hypothetical protein